MIDRETRQVLCDILNGVDAAMKEHSHDCAGESNTSSLFRCSGGMEDKLQEAGIAYAHGYIRGRYPNKQWHAIEETEVCPECGGKGFRCNSCEWAGRVLVEGHTT